jgi:hypothetical protein
MRQAHETYTLLFQAPLLAGVMLEIKPNTFSYTPKLKKRTALLRKLKDVFRRFQSQPVDGIKRWSL